MAEPVFRPVGTAFEEAVALLDQRNQMPGCVIFGLDQVLWSSLKQEEGGSLFPQTAAILAALKARGVRTAAAAVLPRPSAVRKRLDNLDISSYLSPLVCCSAMHLKVIPWTCTTLLASS